MKREIGDRVFEGWHKVDIDSLVKLETDEGIANVETEDNSTMPLH